MFPMWLGEQVSRRGVGNGISPIIFAGIVAVLPSTIVRLLGLAQQGQMSPSPCCSIAVMAVLWSCSSSSWNAPSVVC